MRYRKIERGGKEERERKEQESGKQNREDDICRNRRKRDRDRANTRETGKEKR